MTYRRRFVGAARALLFAAVAAAGLYLATRPDGYAADKSDPPKTEAGPLDFVPTDAVLVGSNRVADYWNQPVLKTARNALGKQMTDAAEKVRQQFGVAPDEIDRVTIFVLAPEDFENGPPLTAISTVKPCDRKAVLDAVTPGANEVKVNGHSLYRNAGQSLTFIDDHTFVMGMQERMEAYLLRPAGGKDGPMTPVLKLAAEKHYLVLGVDVAAVAKAIRAEKLPPPLQPLKPLLKAQLATLTVDLDEQLRADLKVTFANETDAKDGAAAIDDALDMARGALAQAVAGLNQVSDAPKSTAILKDVQAALRAAKAEQKGSTVEVTAAMKLDPEATSAALAEAVEKVQAAALRMRMVNDLKQLALGAQNYHDTIGNMPQAAIYDKNGKPLLSWRVMLLPYIEQQQLYNEFHLDEPWDSEHNKKLLEKMPTVFAPPESEAFKKHEAVFQALVGKDTPLGGKDSKVSFVQITAHNGTSNTILFVEAAKGVPWTKPDDISLDAGKLLPKLGGMNKGGFLAAFCDGSVRFLSLTVDEKDLRRAATYTNEEPFTLPDK